MRNPNPNPNDIMIEAASLLASLGTLIMWISSGAYRTSDIQRIGKKVLKDLRILTRSIEMMME